MLVKPISFNKNAFYLNKMKKNNVVTPNLTFKGVENNNSSENPENKVGDFSYNVTINPCLQLYMQLVKDGFNKKNIQELEIFKSMKANEPLIEEAKTNVDFDLEEYTVDDFIIKRDKSLEDCSAMVTAYSLLREKFLTPDVQTYSSQWIDRLSITRPLENSSQEDKDILTSYASRVLLLGLLKDVNKNNLPVLKKLLADDNFNNAYIHIVLLPINPKTDVKYPLQVLDKAEEIGYDHKFSLPLAVMMSEANEQNITGIEKMLEEQDFFTENLMFVATKLRPLLRKSDSDLFKTYSEDLTFTMEEVNEVLNLNNSDFE